MELTPFEQDMEKAHYYALGAVHQYRPTDWDAVIYPIASGFSTFYAHNVWMGLAKAWDEYVAALVALKRLKASS